MPDVTISYRGSQIASMDASGTKTLETAGKYCDDDVTIAYTRPSENHIASGEFTLPGITSDVSITHNLNSSCIFVVMQRINTDHSIIDWSESRYRSITFFGGTTQLIALDELQGYRFNGGNTLYYHDDDTLDGYPTGIRAYFGSETSSDVPTGITSRPARMGVIIIDSNTVKVNAGYAFVPGRWVWRAYGI